MPTTMLLPPARGETREYECRTQNLTSADVRAVTAHLQRNGLTMGFSVQFAVHPGKGEVVEVMKKGKLVQRDVRPLVEAGFTEWLYSWAFSGKRFRLSDGREVGIARKLDLIKTVDLLPWARAFGYI